MKLDDVFSNIFGKSSRSITNHISQHFGDTFNVEPFIDDRCKTPIEEIQSTVEGSISTEQAMKLRQCRNHNDQSNHKIKSTRISHAGSYFKPVLVQIANALIKSKKHPQFTTRYRRIKARRGHKKAIIAICRMILTAIWLILTDLKPYTQEGFP